MWTENDHYENPHIARLETLFTHYPSLTGQQLFSSFFLVLPRGAVHNLVLSTMTLFGALSPWAGSWKSEVS